MKFNTQIYKEARQTQNKIYSLQEAENERHEKENREIYFKYSKLESELRQKKFAEERKAEEKHKAQTEALKNQRAEADEQNKQFKRIIAFMDILKKEDEFKKDDFGAYVFDYQKDENGKNDYSKDKEKVYLNSIDTLHEDENLILKVYIGDNRKPKNKKSLFVLGKTILMRNHFESDILKIPHDYGISTHEENAHIRQLIKDFPNTREAEAYYKKNKEKILKSFIEEHKKAVAELEEVRKNTNSKEWNILYLEAKKEYFETSYSRHEENEDYKKVVAELEALKGVY